jgi:hypothetical protein
VASRQTKPFATTVTACCSPWYSRTSTVPGLRRLGRSAFDQSPRPGWRDAWRFANQAPQRLLMCQQRNRATRSLVTPGRGDVRNVARHRLRRASRPSDRMRSISASTASRSNEERGMAVRQPCVLTDLSASARHPSPRCGRRALHLACRTRVSGRASCAPPLSKSHGPNGAASPSQSLSPR